MYSDRMIEDFSENLSNVENLIKKNNTEKALKVAGELIAPLPHIADDKLRKMVIALVEFIQKKENQKALLAIDIIKDKINPEYTKS